MSAREYRTPRKVKTRPQRPKSVSYRRHMPDPPRYEPKTEIVTYSNVIHVSESKAKAEHYNPPSKQYIYSSRYKIGKKLITALPCYFQPWNGRTPKEQANSAFVSRYRKEIF